MKTLRDIQLFNIVHDLPEYQAVDKMYQMEIALTLFDFICSSYKNIAFQSAAMQIGLSVITGDSKLAFHTGATILINCKDFGIYDLKQNEKSIWLTPILQFEEDELYLLEDIHFETHELPEVVNDNEDIILSQFSKHTRNLNYMFLNKINTVPFELDMDVLLNFAGENMPITYDKLTAEYLTKPIFFQWKYDSRGRSYSTGYALNIQGNKTVRSVLQLKNKEVIKDLDTLHIALANARGFDSWTWERRIKWAKEQTIDHSMAIPAGTKYPEKYVKTVRAILDYHDKRPSGFMMELDATASGIQIMAAITGCKVTADTVNLVDPTKRKDIYTTMARKMIAVIGKPLRWKEDKEWAEANDVYSDRDYVKYPGMTHYYNSLATPKDVFDPEELAAFYSCLDGLLPGAEHAMHALNTCWNPLAKYHSWTLPDGHVAFVRTMTAMVAEYSYGDTTVKYQYYVNKGNVTDFRSLVPNIVHSIDGYIVRQMILQANFELVHVHDCFLFHPNYFEEVKELYRKVLASLVTDYNINHIIKDLKGVDPQFSVDASLGDKIRSSSYALS